MVPSWKQYANQLPDRRATDGFITETELQMQNSEQRSSMTPNQYDEALRTRVLRRNHVYTKYTLKSISIEELTGYTRYSMPSDCNYNMSTTIQDVARYSISFNRTVNIDFSLTDR